MDNQAANIDLYARKAALEREKALLLRIKQLKENYGINFYRPHWKQHKFHTSDATGRYGRTGNRFGKSEMGIAEDIAWCLGGRVWYKETFDIIDGERNIREHHVGSVNHPYITKGIPKHPVKGLLIVVDWDMAKRIFTGREGGHETYGKLFKMLPKDSVGKVSISRGGHVEKVEIKRLTEFGGGSSTLSIDTIESYKHNRLGAESADWDFIHVDEPCPESMFKAHSRGLMDRDGHYWFTCTPLDEMWINDKFTPPGRVVPDSNEGHQFDTKFIITGAIYDNPYRTEAGVLEFESGLTREERACRLYGLPLAMAGLVYKEFVYDEHVLEKCPFPSGEWFDPPRNYTIRVAWDVHGARVPQAVLMAATAPDGTVFIYDEMFCEPLITPNAELLARKLAGRNVVAQIIDPRAMIKNPVTDSCDVLDAICACGLYFDPASKDLTTGISKVKEKLEERHVVTKKPTIYFSPRLTQTMFEFTHYIYDLEKNEPKDKDNHMMENLYRLVLNGLEYVEPVTDADYVARAKPVRFDEDRHGFGRVLINTRN